MRVKNPQTDFFRVVVALQMDSRPESPKESPREPRRAPESPFPSLQLDGKTQFAGFSLWFVALRNFKKSAAKVFFFWRRIWVQSSYPPPLTPYTAARLDYTSATVRSTGNSNSNSASASTTVCYRIYTYATGTCACAPTVIHSRVVIPY